MRRQPYYILLLPIIPWLASGRAFRNYIRNPPKPWGEIAPENNHWADSTAAVASADISRDLRRADDDDRHGGTAKEENTSNPPSIPGFTMLPTSLPSYVPSDGPTSFPTIVPTSHPSDAPTLLPTLSPTNVQTDTPSSIPTLSPSERPTKMPSWSPSVKPSFKPTLAPSYAPTVTPTLNACNDLSSGTFGNTSDLDNSLIVSYMYEVAVNTSMLEDMGDTFLTASSDLEKDILQSLVNSLFTECSDNGDDGNNTARNLFVRRIADSTIETRSSNDDIAGISTMPLDLATGSICDIQEGSGADACYVMSGASTIYLSSPTSDDSSYTQMVLTELSSMMNEGKLDPGHPAIIYVNMIDDDSTIQGGSDSDRGGADDDDNDVETVSTRSLVPVALISSAGGAFFLFVLSLRYQYHLESKRLARSKEMVADESSTDVNDFVEVPMESVMFDESSADTSDFEESLLVSELESEDLESEDLESEDLESEDLEIDSDESSAASSSVGYFVEVPLEPEELVDDLSSSVGHFGKESLDRV